MIYRNLLIWFALWIAPILVLGQSDYSGTYQWGAIEGKASFSYNLESGDTILNGPFLFEHGYIDSLAERDNYFHVKGAYTMGTPDSIWNFQFGEFEPTGSIHLEDDQYRMYLDGTLHRAKGRLSQGKYQGKWVHEVNEIENSKAGTQLFRSEVSFESGISQLAFQIKSSDNTLLGRFLRNGLAHDVWTLYAREEQSEHWHFKEGMLEKVVFPLASNQIVAILPDFEGATAVINLNGRYLSILDALLKLSDKNSSIFSGATSQLLLENSQYYSKIEDLLYQEGSLEIPLPFRVKVPYQPLTDTQRKDLDQVRYTLSLIDSLSEEIISSSSINIAKVADEDISYWQAIIAYLSSEYLQPTRILLQYDDAEILDYIPKGPLWDFLEPGQDVRSELPIRYEILGSEVNRPYAISVPDEFGAEPGKTGPIVRATKSILNEIDSIGGLLRGKVESGGDIDKFAKTEEQLIEELEIINDLVDSSRLEGQAARALEHIQKQAVEELAKYSSVVDIRAKEIQGSQALNCLIHLKHLSQQIALIPTRWELIEVEYTDKVWNNFTSTVMSEEVKKRITSSYRDVIIPHFLGIVNEDLSCVNAEQLVDAFKRSHEKIYELRSIDTTKLERKLKKTKDPKTVLSTMGLDFPNLVKS